LPKSRREQWEILSFGEPASRTLSQLWELFSSDWLKLSKIVDVVYRFRRLQRENLARQLLVSNW
jgi:hypothetical protein